MNKEKPPKSNPVNFPTKDDLSESGTFKTDALLKEVSLKLWKDYVSKRNVSKRKNGEASRKELMKELLRCSKSEQKKEQKKENNGRSGSEDDADGEKSGNEDSTPKLKKKVLKKRKFSEAINSGKF